MVLAFTLIPSMAFATGAFKVKAPQYKDKKCLDCHVSMKKEEGKILTDFGKTTLKDYQEVMKK
ncbi:MAG: hypothetical protein A2Z97_14540 [Bdellovibrionales bacterium GWB1_52_6]|nr:MAG: hypothetical protein A2Z97_14540 [Bdellovibrionales bacterium GWB1_52_6]